MERSNETINNPLPWKLWHSLNYLIGGVAFFFGSAFLFPHLNHYFPATLLSAWLYTIGSFTFVVSDATQWLHYLYKDCRHFSLVVNFFLSVIGSALYLIGSACFLPQINRTDLGIDYFIYGSSFVAVSQTWKLIRAFKDVGVKTAFNDDPSGILVDLFAGLGGLLGYFIGSLFFQMLPAHPNSAYPGASFFTLGGTLFLLSGIFMQKRYYCEQRQKQDQLILLDS